MNVAQGLEHGEAAADSHGADHPAELPQPVAGFGDQPAQAPGRCPNLRVTRPTAAPLPPSHSALQAAWQQQQQQQAFRQLQQQRALQPQLQAQLAAHEQRYLLRQSQEAQHPQQQQQQQPGVDFAGPSTPTREAEAAPAATAEEVAAYEAYERSNGLLKGLHFERLRRLTIQDDDRGGGGGGGSSGAGRWGR